MSNFAVQLDYIRKQLHKNELIKKYSDLIEEKTKINIEYIVSGLTLIPVIMVFYGIGAQFISNIVGFVYPLISTIRALESFEKEDDTYWLIYWMVFSFICIVEGFVSYLLYWIPFFYPLKICFLFWLFLPQFGGAKILYHSIILPQFQKHQDKIDAALGTAEPKQD